MKFRYLTEQIHKKPVIVYNYPKDIKAFYMRLNDDGKTVAAMDVLVPKVGLSTFGHCSSYHLALDMKTLSHISVAFKDFMWSVLMMEVCLQVGELVGGSQREERLDVLLQR